MKLTGLWLGRQVTDLSPLKDMPISEFVFLEPEQFTEFLRSINTLETINQKPVAEFWKEVEEKNAEKEQ